MKKSTFICKSGCKLLYEYKGYRYTIDTRNKPIADQHRVLRESINKRITTNRKMEEQKNV